MAWAFMAVHRCLYPWRDSVLAPARRHAGATIGMGHHSNLKFRRRTPNFADQF
jgi:hypothetical protein